MVAAHRLFCEATGELPMAREDRFYAFIIAHTSRSRARVQRIRVEKRSVSIFCLLLLLVGVALFYGLYGLTQQAAHLRTEFEKPTLARRERPSKAGTGKTQQPRREGRRHFAQACREVRRCRRRCALAWNRRSFSTPGRDGLRHARVQNEPARGRHAGP